MSGLLTRWIVGAIWRTTLLVAAALGGVLFFFDLLEALDRLGEDGWTLGRVVGYAALLQPGRWLELLPVALLVGSAAALATMARQRELTVLRVSGLSRWGLWWRVALAAAGMAAVTLALAEWGVPFAEERARRWEQKEMASGRSGVGLWVVEGEAIVHLSGLTPDQRLPRATWYRLAEGGRRLIAIEEGREGVFYPKEEGWRFASVTRRFFTVEEVREEVVGNFFWRTPLTPETLSVLWVEPSRMALSALDRYVEFLTANGLEGTPYRVALWRKWLLPLTFVVLASLAIPFVLTTTRTAQFGWRVLAVTGLGVAFHLLHQLSERLALLFSLPPFWAAAAPTMLFAIAAAALWGYIERR
ncbi:MAG: LPS export ABC transporter permease LptG [Hydrogenophilus sp.]|nr:LPS export ABC transporter permease LptG [Hydrogenophilus sp.]